MCVVCLRVCVRACSSRTQEIYTTWSKLKIPGRENYLEAEASEGAPKEKNKQQKAEAACRRERNRLQNNIAEHDN